uniref:DUF4097 family beta strand repeat-containing protein n=1 Tax=Carnobacterium sp. TaxID=48221 RepID=UPI00344B5E7C
MLKKAVITLLILVIIGSALFYIGNTFADNDVSSFTEKNSFSAQIDKENVEKNLLEANFAGENIKIDDFTDIDIDVMSANIFLVYGDDYSLKYNIHDREKIKTLDVSNGVLRFSTTFKLDMNVDYGDWYVQVTIPKGTEMGDLNLNTVSGDIAIEDSILKNAQLNSTSGEISIINSKIDTAEIKSVSNKISIEDSEILKIKAENKSDDIILAGTFHDIDLYSVSGNLIIKGTPSNQSKIETVSGNIDLFLTEYVGVSAKSYGKIEYNNNDQGYKFNNSQGSDNIYLKSVSGKIQIKDK